MSDHVKHDATPGLLGRLVRHGRRDARRTSVAVAVIAGFVALTTGIAFAFWSSTGTGTATASTGTLAPPIGTAASTTSGSGTVSVSWNVPTTGVAPTGYRVSRTSTGGGSPVSVCGTGTTLVTGTSCSDTSVPDGTYTYVVTSIRASWTAAGTASGPVTVTNTIATTTTVTSSANPAVVGQTVTYTATVTQATGASKPTGSVVFKDGSSTIACTGGTQTLSAGTATCSLSYPGVGTHSVTAVYGGAGVFTGSASSPALAQAVNAASTTTTLASSTNPSVTGQSVTFTATVAVVAPGSGAPTGTVTFKDGATTLSCTGNQTLDASGQATCTVPFSSAGAKSVVGTYGGSTNYLTSSSASLSQNVNSATTTTTVTSSGLSSVTGQSVTYTASVSPVSPGAGTPTGTVAFKDAGVTIPGCAAQTLSAGGATCVVTPSVGSHPITAVYAGTADFATSTSSSITQVVSAASTSTSLTSSANPSVAGQTVTFTATVTAVSPGTGTPTGTVSFTSGGSSITCTGGTQTLNGSGVATCDTTFSVGTKTVVATYAGSTSYLTSTSGNVSQVTNKASTSTVVTSSKNPQKTGFAVTYTATVTATSPGAGTPTGSVAFKDGGVTISACATQTMSGGVATCAVSSYGTTGTHTITAVYVGDSNYVTSTSATLTERIVDANVAGLGFVNVKVTDTHGTFVSATPTCSGPVGTTYTCTVNGQNSGSISTDFAFINSSGVATSYTASTDSSSTLTWITSKNATQNSAGVAAGASSTTGNPTATVTQSGNSGASITVTFNDGLNSFQAVLKIQ